MLFFFRVILTNFISSFRRILRATALFLFNLYFFMLLKVITAILKALWAVSPFCPWPNLFIILFSKKTILIAAYFFLKVQESWVCSLDSMHSVMRSSTYLTFNGIWLLFVLSVFSKVSLKYFSYFMHALYYLLLLCLDYSHSLAQIMKNHLCSMLIYWGQRELWKSSGEFYFIEKLEASLRVLTWVFSRSMIFTVIDQIWGRVNFFIYELTIRYHNKKKRGSYKVLYSFFLVGQITEILEVLKAEIE